MAIGEELGGRPLMCFEQWWPPAKIAARHLAPYLAQRLLRVPEDA